MGATNAVVELVQFLFHTHTSLIYSATKNHTWLFTVKWTLLVVLVENHGIFFMNLMWTKQWGEMANNHNHHKTTKDTITIKITTTKSIINNNIVIVNHTSSSYTKNNLPFWIWLTMFIFTYKIVTSCRIRVYNGRIHIVLLDPLGLGNFCK